MFKIDLIVRPRDVVGIHKVTQFKKRLKALVCQGLKVQSVGRFSSLS